MRKISLVCLSVLVIASFALMGFAPLRIAEVPPSMAGSIHGGVFTGLGTNATVHAITFVQFCDGSSEGKLGGFFYVFYEFPHPNPTVVDFGKRLKKLEFTWHEGPAGGDEFREVLNQGCHSMTDLGNMIRVENKAKFPGQYCYVIAPKGVRPGVESMTRTCESKNSWFDLKPREGFIGFDPATGKMAAKITAEGEVYFDTWDNSWGYWEGDPNDVLRAPVLYTPGVGRWLLHQYCQMYKQIGTPKVLGHALCG